MALHNSFPGPLCGDSDIDTHGLVSAAFHLSLNVALPMPSKLRSNWTDNESMFFLQFKMSVPWPLQTTLWGTSSSGTGNPFHSRLSPCKWTWSFIRWTLWGVLFFPQDPLPVVPAQEVLAKWCDLCGDHSCFLRECSPVLRVFSSQQISPLPLNSMLLRFSGHIHILGQNITWMAPTTIPEGVHICLWKLLNEAFTVELLLAFPSSNVAQEWPVLI